MKKGISRWSLPPEMPLDACFRTAKAAGYDGLELSFDAEGDLDMRTTRADAEKVRRAADGAGVQIAGLATGLLWERSITHPDPAVRRSGVEAVDKMLDIAAWLGVDAILVVPGAVEVFFLPDGPVVPYDVAWERSRESIAGLVAKAEANGVTIGLENVWNKFLLSPLEMKAFIDGFGSERVGSWFDVGNVLAFGYPEQWIPILGGRICRVHLKDYKTAVGSAAGFCDLGEGDVDWPAVIEALKGIGYDGFVTAEMLPAYRHFPAGTLHATSMAMDFILGRRSE